MNNILSCTKLHKSYHQAGVELKILDGIDLQIKSGETVSVVGSSGSGKSTLLHILAGLDQMTSGDVVIDGQSLSQLNDSQICSIRNQKLGFIYQFHHLLPEFTALENVLMPLLISGKPTTVNQDFARHLLSRMGLDKRSTHYPAQLSGGERQRVAIARAIINSPKIIFADEPTGNLDNHTGSQVLDIFFKLQQEVKTSLIVVTHDSAVAAQAQTHYRLQNGILVAE